MNEKQKDISLRLKEEEIQYVKNLLFELKDKSKHKPDYWENKTAPCLNVALKLLMRKESDESVFLYNYKTSKEILMAFIKIRPDSFEALYHLAICYDFFNENSERDKIHREILEWAMGDWNHAVNCIKSNNNEAFNSLIDCIQKLTYLIDWAPSFYYAYKMRAKCYRVLRKKEEEISDMENYELNFSKLGPQPILGWTEGFNFT